MKTLPFLTLLTLSSSLLWAADGATLAKKNGCFACHQTVGKKSAPPFGGSPTGLRMPSKPKCLSEFKRSKESSRFAEHNVPYSEFSGRELSTLGDWISLRGVEGPKRSRMKRDMDPDGSG